MLPTKTKLVWSGLPKDVTATQLSQLFSHGSASRSAVAEASPVETTAVAATASAEGTAAEAIEQALQKRKESIVRSDSSKSTSLLPAAWRVRVLYVVPGRQR